MPTVRRRGWWRAILGIGLALACAASPAEPPHALRFEQLGVEQGLAQDSATAILQDRQGFMWFGSQAGLARYDGLRLVLFQNRPDDPASLSDNWITALREDGDGRLWVGTRGGGVLRYDAGRATFQRFVPAEPAGRGIGNLQIRSIIEDASTSVARGAVSHAVWIATADGLEHLDTRSGAFRIWHHDPGQADSLANDDVQAIAVDRQGRLWVGTAAGLDRLRPDRRAFDHVRMDSAEGSGTKPGAVRALYVDSHNVLWIGKPVGLEAWSLGSDPPVRRILGAPNGLSSDPVQCILEDHDGVIWVGTLSTGLLRWDPENNRFVSYRHDIRDTHSLADDDIDSLFQDRSGTLWVGTHDNGISRIDLDSGGFERFVSLGMAQATRDDDKVYSIAVDREDHLWLGTVGGGLLRVDRSGGQFTAFRHDPSDTASLPDNFVRSVYIDPQDKVWVGTGSGLARFDPLTRHFVIRHLADHGSQLDTIRRIAPGRSGILWIGTEGGLHRYDPATDSLRTIVHDPNDPYSLSQGRVAAILEDRNGTLWVGTDGGLDRWDAVSGRFTHFRHDPAKPDSLSHNRVHHLFRDRTGHLWVGTAGGLNRLDIGNDGLPHFRTYTHKDGLAADPIGAILEDAAGQLWISTTAGISRFDPSSGKFRNYSGRDGLTDGSYFIGSGYAADDGSFYFGGLSGLTAFHPEAIRDNPVPPPIVVTELQIFNRPVPAQQRPDGVSMDGTIETAKALRLSHANSVFSLEFAALHYADPLRNRYAYQLVGFDPDWVQTDASRRFATYTNLNPGHYTFRVKAANKDGIWNETGASLDITIDPPFWATWWFRSLAAAALLGSLWALFRYRVRGLNRQRTLLEAEVAARTAEVVKQKEDIEQAHANLSVLGEIGREITAMLDESAVFATLDRHVHALLDASTFAIYLLDDDGRGLTSALRMEGGKALPVARIELDNPTRHAARCARERCELQVDTDPDDVDPSYVPGTLRSLSSLFAPLAIGDRLLGVMTIQSVHQHAYGERERLVFRTLCAYGAIALDNASAYRRLAESDEALQTTLGEQQAMFHQVNLLAELSGFLQACPSADDAFSCIGTFGPRLFPQSAGAIYLAEEESDSWIERGAWAEATANPSIRAVSFAGSDCWALRRSQAYRVDAPESSLCCKHVMSPQGRPGPYACLPLTAQGKTFGLLFIEYRRAASGAEADRRHALAVALAEQSGLAIANIRLRELLVQQSIRDPLTGLYNRRFLQEALFREMAHSKRNQTTFAVLMLDVDHFKKFNDTFGHHAGDVVLQNVARTIEARFRRSDIACRFGGEEFTVLLPGTSIELAQRLANGLLEGVRDLVLNHENRPLDRVTISLGIALFPEHGSTPQALIEAADAALYQAKEAGRNRVIVCGSSAS